MNQIYSKILLVSILIISLAGCTGNSGSGDAPVAVASAEPASMYDEVTPLGLMVQSNGYSYDPYYLDMAFAEVENCLGYLDISSDIYLILKEPFSAFPCVPLANGCGGLFDLDNGEPVITVTADLIRLKHEYVHFMLYYSTGDPDGNHETDNFNQCA